MIIIKSQNEIDYMIESGKILAETHNRISDYIKEGISTLDIDNYGKSIVEKYNATCSFYKLYNFPNNFCISINDEVIHGIPSKNKILKDGDIVKVDGGVCYKGYHTDAARTHTIGKVDINITNFIKRTEQSFFEALKVANIDNHINDIGNAIYDYISNFGYGIVKDFVGHGIGSKVHEDPDIPNFRNKSKGAVIKSNMTLAIEPMINLGREEVYIESDDWTVKTVDKSLSAHYENTILITENGPKILTLL